MAIATAGDMANAERPNVTSLQRGDFEWEGDDQGFWPVARLAQQYRDYLTVKVNEYMEQRQSRHYYHGAHYTAEEIEILRKRRQPVITINRTARKIDAITGLVMRLRQDPKAYPRNPKSADGAEIASQCVRTVLDGNNWRHLDPFCARQAAIEGIAGIEMKLVPGDQGDPDIGLDFIFGDDYFYDPRSFKDDFTDARFNGIAKWLDVEAAIELFPDKEVELRTLMTESGFDLTTHADREFKWILINEKRVRLVEHWYIARGMWRWTFYCADLELARGMSPFRDERNRSCSRFIMFSAAVDHDGDRYGFPRNLKGPQDEVNARRSKALHMSNVTRVMVEKGSVDDIERFRLEMSRPDGVGEYNTGFQVPVRDDKTTDLQAQLTLLQDARMEIDSFANVTPDILATPDSPIDAHSGVAINMLQKAGVAELGPFLDNYSSWKMRVYRAIWNTVQHVWTNERFIRVSSNDQLVQFFQINQQRVNQFGQPMTVNALGSLDVDIILDEGPEMVSLLQDAYTMLRDDPTVPWQVKLEVMPMASSVKKGINQAMQQAAQQQAQQPNPEAMKAQAQIQIAQQKGQVDLQKGQQQAATQAAKSQSEIAKARMDATAQMENARQDQAQKTLAWQMERERSGAEMARLRMETIQSAREHQYKMEEGEQKLRTMRAQHEAKRVQARQRGKQKPAQRRPAA
jgi:hypothetical protein